MGRGNIIMGAGNRMLQGRNGRNQYDITKENMDDLRKQFEMKNVLPVTHEQLDHALDAWAATKETAIHEQAAWSSVIRSHDELIALLRSHGHTWSQAQVEFNRLSNTHRNNLMAAWEAMDARCGEYQSLLVKFRSQQSEK